MQNPTGTNSRAKAGKLSKRLMSAYIKSYMDSVIHSAFDPVARASLPGISDDDIIKSVLNHKIESLVNITKDYNESGSSSKKVKSGEIKKIKNSSKDITSPTPSTSKVSTCTPYIKRKPLIIKIERNSECEYTSKKVKPHETDKFKNSSKDITSPTPSTSKVSTYVPDHKRKSSVENTKMKGKSDSKRIKVIESVKFKSSSDSIENPIPSTSKVSTYVPDHKRKSSDENIKMISESSSKRIKLIESDKFKNSSGGIQNPIPSTSKVSTFIPDHKRKSSVENTKINSESKRIKVIESDKFKSSSDVIKNPVPSTSKDFTFIPDQKRKSLVKITDEKSESESSSKKVRSRISEQFNNSPLCVKWPTSSTSNVPTYIPNYKRKSLVKITEKKNESVSSSEKYQSNKSDKFKNSSDGIDSPSPSTSKISKEITNICNAPLKHTCSENEKKINISVRDISKLMVKSNIKSSSENSFPEIITNAASTPAFEEYSMSEIDRLYYRYFSIILIEDVTIIANIMNIIEIFNEHDPPNKTKSYFKAKIKQKNALENKIVEMLNLILPSFDESHRLLIFCMFYLSILKVIGILKKDQKIAVFRKIMPILWECLKKKSFTQKEFRVLFVSKQFRSLVSYLINKIYDKQVTDQRPEKRLEFFFMTSIRGEEYFQKIIDLIQTNDRIEDMGDMKILINTATSEYYNSRPVDRICSTPAATVHNSNRTFIPCINTSMNAALSGITDQTHNADFQSRSVTHNRHTVIQFAHSNLNVRQPYLTNCLRNDVIKITPPSTQYGLHGLIQRSNVALNPVEFSRNPTVNNTNCTMILNNTQYHLYSIPLSPIQRVPINPITVIRSVPNRSDQANVNEPTFSTHQLADYTTEYYQNNE